MSLSIWAQGGHVMRRPAARSERGEQAVNRADRLRRGSDDRDDVSWPDDHAATTLERKRNAWGPGSVTAGQSCLDRPIRWGRRARQDDRHALGGLLALGFPRFVEASFS